MSNYFLYLMRFNEIILGSDQSLCVFDPTYLLKTITP